MADHGLEIVLLARHVEERLPRLLVVEGRMERVGANGAEVALGVSGEHGEAGILLETRYEVHGRVLPEIHLTRLERGGGRGLVRDVAPLQDRKSTRLNSSHLGISYAVFCLKKKKQDKERYPL